MTHSFIVKISFDKADFNIYPGMYSKILIDLNSAN
jgi:membrane fusion protein, multidrug efflux system